jgi:hypothetical protein
MAWRTPAMHNAEQSENTVMHRSIFLPAVSRLHRPVPPVRLGHLHRSDVRLNITPWNPDPALGLVFWLIHGRKAALPWFIALLAGEVLVRGMPAGLPLTLLCSAWLVLGYGGIGAALRRSFSSSDIFDNRRRLSSWLAIVLFGTMFNALGYIRCCR